jgi:TetR/AcrR family transcriptional repressor of nem operon
MAQVNLKEKLLGAATDLFHTKGFNAASVDDIVRAAGVPKGSFYNHFPSKEALGVEVVRRYANGYGEGIALLGATGTPALDRLRAHLEFMVQRNATLGVERGCMLGNFATEMAAQSPAIAAALQEAFAFWSNALVPVVAELGHDADMADYIVNGLEGAFARAKVTASRRPLDQFIAVTLSTVVT